MKDNGYKDSSPVADSHPAISNDDHEPAVASRKVLALYDDVTAGRILDLYTGGESLTKIAERPGMPARATIARWLKDKDAFRARMKAAHETRAFLFFDDAMTAAYSTHGDSKAVPSARLEYEASMRAAEVNDPATYGKSMKVSGDPDRPLRIVLSTGLPPKDIDNVKLDEQGLLVQPVPIPMPDDHDEQMQLGDLE